MARLRQELSLPSSHRPLVEVELTVAWSASCDNPGPTGWWWRVLYFVQGCGSHSRAMRTSIYAAAPDGIPAICHLLRDPGWRTSLGPVSHSRGQIVRSHLLLMEHGDLYFPGDVHVQARVQTVNGHTVRGIVLTPLRGHTLNPVGGHLHLLQLPPLGAKDLNLLVDVALRLCS